VKRSASGSRGAAGPPQEQDAASRAVLAATVRPAPRPAPPPDRTTRTPGTCRARSLGRRLRRRSSTGPPRPACSSSPRLQEARARASRRGAPGPPRHPASALERLDERSRRRAHRTSAERGREVVDDRVVSRRGERR
jgi:hypothetical protein